MESRDSGIQRERRQDWIKEGNADERMKKGVKNKRGKSKLYYLIPRISCEVTVCPTGCRAFSSCISSRHKADYERRAKQNPAACAQTLLNTNRYETLFGNVWCQKLSASFQFHIFDIRKILWCFRCLSPNGILVKVLWHRFKGTKKRRRKPQH